MMYIIYTIDLYNIIMKTWLELLYIVYIIIIPLYSIPTYHNDL